MSALSRSPALVVEAPPGAGKTTRVPVWLLESKIQGEIVVLEPRRLAARLAAKRVAADLGEKVGERVGYAVRFDEVAGPNTRIRFVTEGVLLRRMQSDPALAGVGAIVLDEFHERHLHGDLVLALARRLEKNPALRRDPLKLVVMSATLEVGPIAHFLGDCPSLRSEGRLYPIEMEFAERPVDFRSDTFAGREAFDRALAQAVRDCLRKDESGSVLVFLPGAAEIRRAAKACARLASELAVEVVTLHGEMPPAEQDRAIAPAKSGERRKVILSTNVAESSVTIEGVRAVVDSGMERRASHSPWSGLPRLSLQPISRASADQRAGRAGRTGPGRCVRLYTNHDYSLRPAHAPAEIRRAELSESYLLLSSLGIALDSNASSATGIDWFEAPETEALDSARELLIRLGALDEEGSVTDVGRKMLRLPVHPRQARMVLAGRDKGLGAEVCLLAALVGERDIVRRKPAHAEVKGPSDLLADADHFHEAARLRFDGDRLREAGLDVGATLAVEQVRKRLAQLLGEAKRGGPGIDHDRALLECVLAGYPDRVARRRSPGSPELLLSAGGTARLSDASVVRDAEFMVLTEIEERAGQVRGQSTVNAVQASAIEPEWLLESSAHLHERIEYQWNTTQKRVERVTRLDYDALTLESRPSLPTMETDQERREVSTVMSDAVRAAGVKTLFDLERAEELIARLRFAKASVPEADLPAISASAVDDTVALLVSGKSSFAELRELDIEEALFAALGPGKRHLLGELAPAELQLPSSRRVKIQYRDGQPPFVESRLQDFLGWKEGPKIARGRVPLTLHLLAPNQRAVQVTSDLAGFWNRTYPELRQALMRRYPRHPWPENPFESPPVSPVPRRRPPR